MLVAAATTTITRLQPQHIRESAPLQARCSCDSQYPFSSPHPRSPDTMKRDMVDERPLWPLSSYSAAKNAPNLLSNLDLSSEELRVRAYDAQKSGQIQQYVRLLNSPCNPCSPIPSIRHPLNQKPLPMLKPSIQRSSMIQKLLTKPNFSLSRRATRTLPRLGATLPRLGNPRPVSGLVRQPSERRRPLVNLPRPLHSDSPQEHPLLVNLLPLQRLDSSLLRALLCRHLAHRPLLLGGHPPLVSQLLLNLHLEHLRSGNRHSVSPASVSPPHRRQLRVRAVVDSQLSHPSQLPLVSPPLVSQASVVAPLHQRSVSPGLGARQQAAELRRERVEVDSAPSHRLRLPTLHKQPPTH